ncbi:glycosyltransferase [Winogradskyella sp.]|nr:glycosyltransferase [Winogradskyella sp.]
MKIVHVNTFDTGGAAVAAKRLHLSLLDSGLDSNMLFAKKTDQTLPNSYQLNTEKKSLLKKIVWRLSRKIGKGKTYWERIEQLLHGRDQGLDMFSMPFTDFDINTQELIITADIIHLHWAPSLVDYNFFSRCNKPIVWTLHDMNAFTGGCHYSAGCEKYTTDCSICSQLKGTNNLDLAKTFLAYKASHLSDPNLSIVTLSDWMTQKAKKSAILGHLSIRKIYNSLNTEIFKPVNQSAAKSVFGLPSDKKIVLFVSERVENYRKGFDLLTNALEHIEVNNVLFCAVGAEPEAVFSHNNVRFLGRMNDEYSLAMLYNSADVLLIPSREDNLPNVMLEALCCGTPVISFANGGMQEIIKNGVNGLLVEKRQPFLLSEAIKTFFDTQNNYNRQEISALAHQTFSKLTQVEKFTNLYAELLNNSNK